MDKKRHLGMFELSINTENERYVNASNTREITQNLLGQKSQSIEKTNSIATKLRRKKTRNSVNSKDFRVTRSLNLNILSDSFETSRKEIFSNQSVNIQEQEAEEDKSQSGKSSKRNEFLNNTYTTKHANVNTFNQIKQINQNKLSDDNTFKNQINNLSPINDITNNKPNTTNTTNTSNYFLKRKPGLNNIYFKNKIFLSNYNYGYSNIKSQEMLINAFNFFLERKFGLYSTKKMIDEFSEEEKLIKMISFKTRFQAVFTNNDSNSDLNNSVNEIFSLFKDSNLTSCTINSEHTEKYSTNVTNNSLTNTENINRERTLIQNSSTKVSSIVEVSLKTAAFSVPHIKKVKKGGEDAFKFDDSIIIVADGVGGWNNKGIDPALFSKTLVENIHSEFSRTKKTLFIEKDLNSSIRNNLQKAIDKTSSIEGSSTISLIVFDLLDRKAYSAYIGDSLYLIARLHPKKLQYELLFVSKEQIHGFNLPFQVGRQCDTSSAACINEHELCNKDLFIVATDGLWDNLSLDIIVSTINQVKNNKTHEIDTKQLSELLTKKAQVVSFNK